MRLNRTLYVVLLLIVASCSIKVTTPGRALVSNKTVEDVFSTMMGSKDVLKLGITYKEAKA